MKCPSCGADNSPTANFCSNCGFGLVTDGGATVVAQTEAPCRVCGSEVPIGARFCGNCGTTSPHDVEPAVAKPAVAKPAAPKPAVAKPAAPKPAVAKPAAPKPAVAKPAVAKPAVAKPAAPSRLVETEPRRSKPIVPPPPKPAGSPIAVPAGWPDVTEELAEVRFLLLQGEDVPAREALSTLQRRFPGHPDLATELVLDRSAVTKRPERTPSAAQLADGAAVDAAAPDAVDPATSDTVIKSTPPGTGPGIEPTVVRMRPDPHADEVESPDDAEDEDDEEDEGSADPIEVDDEDADEGELVTSSGGWGDAPEPGGTVIARAPSRTIPNVLPRGTDSRGVIISHDTDETDPTEVEGITDRDATKMAPIPTGLLRTTLVPTSFEEGELADDEDPPPAMRGPEPEAPDPVDRTMVSPSTAPMAPPRPPRGGEVEEEWLEGGSALDLVVARPGRPRKPAVTMVSEDPQRPPPPAPFGGEPPPGSTMVPGTTPPKGGFPPQAEHETPVDFEERLPFAARGAQADDDEAETTEVSSIRMPLLTPAPYVPTTAEFVDDPATLETPSLPGAGPQHTPEGTVIMVNPLPPAPFEGKPPAPIEPVRMVMLGSRGQPVAERTLAPGEMLEVGRDASEPWGDDDFLEPQHARIRPAPGGGVSIDDFDGRGPVYRQVEHRRQIRSGDQFRVGQSLIRFFMDAQGTRLEVQAYPSGDATTHPMIGSGLLLGREAGDVVFPDDTYVSSSHCRFSVEGGTPFVEDLGSSNGTYVRVRPGDTVEFGALLLLGHTQFRIQAVP